MSGIRYSFYLSAIKSTTSIHKYNKIFLEWYSFGIRFTSTWFYMAGRGVADVNHCVLTKYTYVPISYVGRGIQCSIHGFSEIH